MSSKEIEDIANHIIELEKKLTTVFNIVDEKLKSLHITKKDIEQTQIKYLEENLPPIT